MIYKSLSPKEIVKIECTLEECMGKNFTKDFKCAVEAKPDQIIIEISQIEPYINKRRKKAK